MKVLSGARRPASARKLPWIVLATIALVLAWARPGLPDSPQCPPPQMGPDGTLQQQPCSSGMVHPDAGRGDGTTRIIHTTKRGKTYTYTYRAPETGATYVITREGSPWLTVTLNKTTGLYEIGDPNVPSAPVITLGTPKRVPVKPDTPLSTH